MNIEEAKEQLRSLQENAKANIDTDEIFKMDYEAIEIILAELKRKDKIIDKMAQKIAKIDNSDKYCLGRKRMCPYDKPTQSKCKECIKYYYEKRNKNGNCKSR